MNKKLAIIIPAFKADFIKETLTSISNQSCKDFNLYIGDDCSPYLLDNIVDEFRDKVSIIYKKFDSNLGGINLVNHWNRCLEMINDEEYLWLFSDDDIMEENCVEQFLKTIDQGVVSNVYHFNIDIIDSNNTIIRRTLNYPKTISAVDFFSYLYQNKIEARVPEFIFKTTSLREKGGFVNFDLAWRSDNATVIANSIEKGIYTIEGPRILWRQSNLNISSYSKEYALRKDYATINFFNWIVDFFDINGVRCPFSKMTLIMVCRQKIGMICKTFNPIQLWQVSYHFKCINSNLERFYFVIISYYVRLHNLLVKI